MAPSPTWKISSSASRPAKSRPRRWRPGWPPRVPATSAIWPTTTVARVHGRRRPRTALALSHDQGGAPSKLRLGGAPSKVRMDALLALAQLANPNIAEAHRVAVVLQTKRQLFRRRFVGRPDVMARGSRQLYVVLYQHSIVQHRHPRRTQ